MAMGLTPQQQVIHLRVMKRDLDDISGAIARKLATFPLSRIISMTMSPVEQFNNEVLVILVIEFLDETAG